MRKKVLVIATLVIVCVLAFAGCSVDPIESYTIPLIDLEENVIWQGNGSAETKTAFSEAVVNDPANKAAFDIMKGKYIVDDAAEFNPDRQEHYIAHPDSIGLRHIDAQGVSTATDEILTVFPGSHGRGPIKGKISYDGGMTYEDADRLQNTPLTWTKSQETPTIYRLTFSDDNVPTADDMLVLVSGNPYWGDDSSYKANGFNVSISTPTAVEGGGMIEGREWSEFETWYGHGQEIEKGNVVRSPRGYMKAYDCIVAMSSLTRLKENGVWADKWMGLFHDHNFNCYKTILSFREPTTEEIDNNTYPLYNGMVMEWSEPVKYFANYRKIERKSNMCEVECLRSDGGNGNKLAIITRSNSKKMNSLISFSEDEGETWSQPRELPAALNGERHKAEWVKVNGEDKLFITFRSIERGTDKVKKYNPGSKWMSEGWVAWVGDWQDLEQGTEGDFRVKLAHTYLNGQEAVSRSANGDTGYCGNVVLPNGRVFTCSYGKFSADADKQYGGRTYIVGKIIDVEMLYKLLV